MAMIAGEPLIVRTLGQLRERGHDENAVVVTHNDAIKTAVPRWFEPEKRRWWPETLLNTRALWQKRNIVLNGDVIFTSHVLGKILDDMASPAFHGQPKEAFSFSFSNKITDRVVTALEVAIEDAKKGGGMAGLIWPFEHALCGLRMRSRQHDSNVYRIYPQPGPVCDIDKYQQYKAYLQKNKWARTV